MAGTTECAIDWDALIPEKDWAMYRTIVEAAQQEHIPFAIGGGLAFSEYAKRARLPSTVVQVTRPVNLVPVTLFRRSNTPQA